MTKLTQMAFAAALVLGGVTSTGAIAQEHAHEGEHAAEGEHGSMHAEMHGSEAESRAVRATVDALFDAMRAADGEAVKSLFAEKARLMSTGERDGKPTIGETPVDGFAGSVAKAAPGAWDERIWNVMIHVNGNLATAWTPYAFYFDGKLSHCGVNAFQLAKTESGWKILQLTDTRQRENCEIPESVSAGT